MKRTLCFATVLGLLYIAACNPSKKISSSQTNETTVESKIITDQKWKLIELAGKPVADKINGKEPFILLQKSDSRYAGTAGCNGLGGSFTLQDKGRIKFSQGMSTMMACENMEIETGLNKAMIAADNYTINGNTLSLNKARMAPLARFQAVKEVAETNALNGTWEVDYVSGAKIAFEGLYPGKKPTITFNLPATQASGNSSCNNYRAAFTLAGNSIKFNDPVGTKMYCEGAGEATFFNTLKTISKYSLNDNTLTLIMGDIAVMRLQKKNN